MSMQSERGTAMLAGAGLHREGLDTILLAHGPRLYRDTAALFRIMHALGWPWRLCWLLWLIPSPVRNGLYRFVARNRYRFLAAATRASSHAQ